MLYNIKKYLHYQILSSNLAAHQGNKSLTLNVKNMKTTKNQETIGKPSARILKAFQVLCDASTLIGSEWVNPSLKVLPDCNEKSIHFFVYCESLRSAYSHPYIDLFSVCVQPDFVQLLYTLDKRFDSLYDYDTNPNISK